MQVELSYGQLPWHHVTDMNAVGQQKQGIRQNLAQLFPPPCPPQFQDIMRMVDQLKYYDAPNYQAIYGVGLIIPYHYGLITLPDDASSVCRRWIG